jgi:hypothetical protein
VRNRTPIYWSSIPHPRRHTESSVLIPSVRSRTMELVGVKGPGKAVGARYRLPGAEDTRTMNLRIKFGPINTEPMKSVREKSSPSFYNIWDHSRQFECGSQAASSHNSVPVFAAWKSQSLPEVHSALRHSGVLLHVTCTEDVLPMLFTCFLSWHVEQVTSVYESVLVGRVFCSCR